MQKRIFSRKWLLTISEPGQCGCDHDSINKILKKWKDICFWCMCDEISKASCTFHTHLFIVGENAIPFGEVKNRFPMAHIDQCQGSDAEIIAYIRKEGEFETDKEVNIKSSFEANLRKSNFISEVIQLVKKFLKVRYAYQGKEKQMGKYDETKEAYFGQ